MSKNIAIIGAGIIGTRLAGVFDQFDDLNILWICDVDKTSAENLSKKYGGRITHDYTEVLQDTEVDIVYVGVPPKFHKEIVISALDANKHVISEKPLALSIADCDMMVSAKNKNELVTAVNLPFRYTPGVVDLIKRLKNNDIGKILRVELRFRFPFWPRKWQPVEWLKFSEQGGPLREVGTHYFFLLGELQDIIGKVKRVNAITRFESDVMAENNSTAIVEFDTGILGTIDLITKNFESEENTITIYGEKGSLSLIQWYKLIGKIGDQDEEVLNETRKSSEQSMVENFMKLINGDDVAIPPVSFESARNAQQILEALYTSNGSWINF
jgi:predicted dehydrogenase